MIDPDATVPMRRMEPAEPSDFLERVRAYGELSARALQLFRTDAA